MLKEVLQVEIKKMLNRNMITDESMKYSGKSR